MGGSQGLGPMQETVRQIHKLPVQILITTGLLGLLTAGVTLFFREFADSSINFELRIWISSPEQPVWLQGRSEAIMNIKKAYDAEGITIPFPIRTLDFGIKGGATLAEMPVSFRQVAERAAASKRMGRRK